MQRIIFHIDVNNAFLSWSAIWRINHGETLDIRTICSVIGGDEDARHGIVVAKSQCAKEHGIKTGMSLFEARRICPDVKVYPANPDFYDICSNALYNHLKNYSPLIERYSIDECFVDFTGTQKLFGNYIDFAQKLREEIYEKLGFSVNIGIGENKLCAKMASDFQKPNRCHTLFPNEIEQKLWPLDIGDLFMVGRSSAKKLNSLGIFKIYDLAHSDKQLIYKIFGKNGIQIFNYANGIDTTAVIPSKSVKAKSYSNSLTTSKNMQTLNEINSLALSLCDKTCTRMRSGGFMAGGVGVSLKYTDLSVYSKSEKLYCFTDSTNDLYSTICLLIKQLWNNQPVRAVGVFVFSLCPNSSEQLSLYTPQNLEKIKKYDTVCDKIRLQYGANSIFRATTMNTDMFNNMNNASAFSSLN